MKNLFRKIKEKGLSLIAKASYIATSFALAMTCPVSAGGQQIIQGDSNSIFKNFINVLLEFVGFAGVGLLVIGLITFFMALRNEDAEKKTAAIWSIIAGIGIISIKSILTAVGFSL